RGDICAILLVITCRIRMDPGEGGGRPAATQRLFPLTLTAVGVVYGDIGTSPLYTIRECFFGAHAVSLNHDNVLGILSLILYALIIVVSLKYIAIVMRADNQGEGGILALAALLPERAPGNSGWSTAHPLLM